MKHLVEIKNDLFSISKRIKKINKKLLVFYNKKTLTFQLYSKSNISLIFEADLGKTLDQKAISFVQKNSVINIAQIVKKMDFDNKKIEDEKRKNEQTFSKDLLSDFISFADRKSSDVDFSKIKIGGRNDS